MDGAVTRETFSLQHRERQKSLRTKFSSLIPNAEENHGKAFRKDSQLRRPSHSSFRGAHFRRRPEPKTIDTGPVWSPKKQNGLLFLICLDLKSRTMIRSPPSDYMPCSLPRPPRTGSLFRSFTQGDGGIGQHGETGGRARFGVPNLPRAVVRHSTIFSWSPVPS